MEISRDIWTVVSPLLDEALDLPDETARQAWLRTLPAHAQAHRGVIERLLAEHAQAETDDFLHRPLGQLAAPAAFDSGADRIVGPYRLVRELGRGGMGSVWLAERVDGLLKRPVALKLPHPGLAERNFAERLERERDILASLNHPHIARLFDAGVTAAGQPFIALEFIEGTTIIDHCDARKLDLAARLALFAQVVEAVRYAHSHLVIHRDLKPSNVLVDAQGQVRLLDFGVAKLMVDGRGEATELTLEAGQALTPDYASPEQILGKPLSTASDVYSLGVLLYQLLTGARPYQLARQGLMSLVQAIATVDIPRPSAVVARDAAAAGTRATTPPQLARALRGDLDTIVLTALKAAPESRYQTAEALLTDLQRHLAGQPVLAQPDSRLYVLRKFVGRNRVPVTAGVAIVLALVAGAAIALRAAAEAKEQALRAEQSLLRQQAVRMFYVETMAAMASMDARKLAEPGAILQTLREKLAELEPQVKDRPQEWLAILNAVSVQLNFAGDFEGALEVGRKYLALLKTTDADLQTLVQAHMTVARNLTHLRRFDESEAVLRDAVALADRGGAALAQVRAQAVPDLAFALVRQGRQREAIDVLRTARAAGEKHFPDENDHFAVLQMLGRLHLGYDDAVALDYARKAEAGFARNFKGESGELGTARAYLGEALLANGLLAEAETPLRDATTRAEALYGPADRDTITNLGRLALALAGQGRYDDARKLLADRLAQVGATKSPDADAARVSLRGRQLQNEMLAGATRAAAAFVDAPDPAVLENTSVRDADAFVIDAARWQSASGRGAAARERIDGALARLAPPLRNAPAGFRLGTAKVAVQVANGQGADAVRSGNDLVAAMRTAGATASWTWREANEWTLLARVRAGDGAGIAAAVDALPDVKAPTPVDEGESWVRRAELLLAAGKPGDARKAVERAASLLGSQDADSPRLAALRDMQEKLGAP